VHFGPNSLHWEPIHPFPDGLPRAYVHAMYMETPVLWLLAMNSLYGGACTWVQHMFMVHPVVWVAHVITVGCVMWAHGDEVFALQTLAGQGNRSLTPVGFGEWNIPAALCSSGVSGPWVGGWR